MICSGSIAFGFVDEMSPEVTWNLKSGYSMAYVHVWLLQRNHTPRPGLSVYCDQRKGALSQLSLRHCVIGGPSSSEQSRCKIGGGQAHTCKQTSTGPNHNRSCPANPNLTSLGISGPLKNRSCAASSSSVTGYVQIRHFIKN